MPFGHYIINDTALYWQKFIFVESYTGCDLAASQIIIRQQAAEIQPLMRLVHFAAFP